MQSTAVSAPRQARRCVRCAAHFAVPADKPDCACTHCPSPAQPQPHHQHHHHAHQRQPQHQPTVSTNSSGHSWSAAETLWRRTLRCVGANANTRFLLVLTVCAALCAPTAEGTAKFRVCGEKLVMKMQEVCTFRTAAGTPFVCLHSADKEYATRLARSFHARPPQLLFKSRRTRSTVNIAHECCTQRCSVAFMQSFCCNPAEYGDMKSRLEADGAR